MGNRLSTDRTDWVYIAECSDHGDEHIRLEASATKASKKFQNPRELFPLDECPGCGVDISYIKQEEPSEVLD